MKKIRFSALLVMFTWISFASGQDLDFRASAREVVSVGDQFRLIYSINGQASGFRAPVIKDFSVLAGPSQSTSTSMQIINNQVSRSVEYSFTYILQATNEGTFTIPPASVNVDGKAYQSNPVTIKVVKGSAPASPGAQQQTQPQGGEITAKDLFVRASVNKSNPYQGEQVIITYKIYTRVPVAEYSITRAPSTAGFWSQDLIKDNTKLNQYRETVDGSEYVVAEIKKEALFAQKSGNLTIEPLEMDVVAQIQRKASRRGFNDPFFDSFFNDSFLGSTYQNVRKTLRSNQLNINVRPLPSANRPSEFTGAVGNFSISSSIDREQLKANEALTLKFTITGKGNIKLVEKPNLVFPSDFEVYDPRITDNIAASQAGVSGSRTFEYLVIPRNPGDFTIKSSRFAFFDIESGTYKTLNSPDFRIKVEKGTGNEANVVAGSSNKEDFKYIGTDIRFIKTSPLKLRPVNSYFLSHPLFPLWLAIPPVLLAAFMLIWRNELRKRNNLALMRNRKATRVARKRLKAAEHFLKQKNQDAFWAEVSNALWGYISDKFNIPGSTLSMDSVNQALKNKNVNEDLITQFISALNNCEFARFAPGDKSQVMDKLYREAIEVITNTEQHLK
ncbi:oxygen tolerance [Lentimicrobium saccharophilum]|uniref:Oxygen tolerance n=1 Tax=Lentimicrobium saccharophilum TaxID=1678841 RepID=A0A0S7BYP8_9BACT|nr:BatD family protein [Lentimicrobium saccharophilum]GAP42785.1 oxygen tolerance [Lentimicrobium saccharophilum]